MPISNVVKLSPYDNGHGTKTEINGVEMQEVTDIHLHCPVDGPPRLTLEQWATPGLDVTIDGAHIKIFLRPMRDDQEIEIERISPKKTRYRVINKS